MQKQIIKILFDNEPIGTKPLLLEDTLLSIREALKNRVNLPYLFLDKEGKEKKKEIEKDILLKDISENKTLKLKSEKVSNVNILIGEKKIFSVVCSDIVNLNSIRNAINKKAKGDFNFLDINGFPIDVKDEGDYSVKDILHNNSIKLKGNLNLIKENKENDIGSNLKKDDTDDVVILTYKINEKILKPDIKNIYIFGYMFVNNNFDKCKIIVNEIEMNLCSYIEISKLKIYKDNTFKIKLKGLKNVTDMSGMFNCGNYIISLPDISNFKTSKVTKMVSLFAHCEELTSLPDISNWDTSNVSDMSFIFESCKSVISLPDISSWNTKNVTNMRGMFRYCESLTYLPDISNWNTAKVTDMSMLFQRLERIRSLPDISEWNTSNNTNLSSMFEFCFKLEKLPDISNWNTSKVKDMSSMFCRCDYLEKMPNIAKWNTENVTSMSTMFCNCSLFKSLPDISKWNTQNVTSIFHMFYSCHNLSRLPDISKWNTQKVSKKDLENIFYGCEKKEDCFIF